MSLEAIKYKRGQLEILDQLNLPTTLIYIRLNDTSDAWNAIKTMQVTFVLLPTYDSANNISYFNEMKTLTITDI